MFIDELRTDDRAFDHAAEQEATIVKVPGLRYSCVVLTGFISSGLPLFGSCGQTGPPGMVR
jgi:hypothetical protein